MKSFNAKDLSAEMLDQVINNLETKQAQLKKKASDMVGVTPVTIEKGRIKYEYSNKFNLRVHNYRKGASGQYSSLDAYVHNMNRKDQEATDLARIKKEEGRGHYLKDENGVKGEFIKGEGPVKGEDGTEVPDCFIQKIDYTQKIPDFGQVPREVVKNELIANGYKTSNLSNTKFVDAIKCIW